VAPLLEVVGQILPDRFLDTGHGALSRRAVQLLGESGIAHPFNSASVLLVLASASQGRHGLAVAAKRCGQLPPEHRDLLCQRLAAALCQLVEAGGDSAGDADARVAVFCGLPMVRAQSGVVSEAPDAAGGAAGGPQAQPHRCLADLTVVDGGPLTLAAPPGRMSLSGGFVFRESPGTTQALADAVVLPGVRSYLQSRERFLTTTEWMMQHVVPHLRGLGPEDQVAVLERLLPLLDVDQANSHALVPAEVADGDALLKPPHLLLDSHDVTIQQVFGITGDTAPALPRASQLHFPARALPAAVRQQLRRLGMRRSANDAACLVFLIQELRKLHRTVGGERYGELQRDLLQRVVESWNQLPGEAQAAILDEEFVDLSPEADGGELPETVFALRPFRLQSAGRLFRLGELVSRSGDTDPYLCWTSLPLCPRGFPAFPGYRRPALDHVIAHARALGEIADASSVSCHLWPEIRERVVVPSPEGGQPRPLRLS